MKTKYTSQGAYYGVFIFILFIALLSITCTQLIPLSGAGSETTSNCVGKVVDTNGLPSPGTLVHLIPQSFNTIRDTADSLVLIDTTDSTGMYGFDTVPMGNYNIQALNPGDGTRLFIGGIRLSESNDTLSAGVLQRPGSMEILLNDTNDLFEGYVFILGTLVSAYITNGQYSLVIDSLPVGTLPALNFVPLNELDTSLLVADTIHAYSGISTFVPFPGWKYSRKLYLNTTSSGAGSMENVLGFPVLVRLNSSNFRFSEARNDGFDIRFTKSNDVPLSYEIARWDSAGGMAELWVLVDTVYGNNSTRYINMQWGNNPVWDHYNLMDVSNPFVVFDTSNGFQGVWHMEAGSDSVKDATKNRFTGISGSPLAPIPADGTVGSARLFDGSSQFITIPGSADGKLNFAPIDTYTVSAWVYADNPAPSNYTLVSKGTCQYSLFIDSTQYWKFSVVNKPKYMTLIGSAAAIWSWRYITCVRIGIAEFFFENGVMISKNGEKTTLIPQPYSTRNNVTIGKDPSLGTGFFSGKIDEVTIASVARSPDWILLSYMNQKNPDALVVFK